MSTAPSREDLIDAGLGPTEAARKAALFADIASALGQDGGTRHVTWAWVPGRIEVLGKHTDYAGGRSLLCATERGLCLGVRDRPDRRLRVRDLRWREQAEGEISPSMEAAIGAWSNYPFTVARRLARDFPEGLRRGADVVLTGDLPPDAGLSSSSALVVATYLALAAVNRFEDDPRCAAALGSRDDLAGYLGAVESGAGFAALPGERGVGTTGGSEDHTAILCGRPGALVQYGFAPVRLERVVPMPGNLVFVVATSGIAASKTGAARQQYNAAAAKARAIADLWRRATGRGGDSLADAVRSAPDAASRLRRLVAGGAGDGPAGDALAGFSRDELAARLEQFIEESETLVPEAASALEAGDLAEFGDLAARSHAAASRGLMNNVPATDALVDGALASGAIAASAFGAGFGGSVWALVTASEAETFVARWLATSPASGWFTTRPGPAARTWS